MATAGYSDLSQGKGNDLTQCGICHDIIKQPKALPCLHTFCLDCIREWCQPDVDNITCPVFNCKKTTPTPSNGVDGLPGNVFVSSFIARSPSRGRNVPCVCCEETNNDVIARCLHADCNGFLCKRGFHLHQDKLLKSHQVVKLEDVKSGKVNMKMLADKKQTTCKEHEGSPLWFFCETCWVLICRDCTIVEHAKPGHNYVTLKSIASEQRKTIEKLVKQSDVNKTQVERALVDAGKAQVDLDKKKKETIADIDREIANIKKHVDKVCEDERKRLLKQQEAEVSAAYKKIQSCMETLQSQKVRFQTASEVANQALKSGSDSDVASVFKQLKDSFVELGKEEIQNVSRNVAQLSEFKANSKIAECTSIGDLRMPSKVSEATWELACTFGEKTDSGKVSNARGMSTTPAGDLVVANWKSSVPVKVYNSNGKYKFSLDKQSCNAWDVTVSRSEGKIYVTSFDAKQVRVFESHGRYVSQFPVISPTGKASDTERANLCGIATNKQNQLLVGDVNKKYISIHELNGVHISSFNVSMEPYFIAITSENSIVVRPVTSYGSVHVLDSYGNLQHTITAPAGVSKWEPHNMCCSANDEICISNGGTPAGIYEYLRCIIKDLVPSILGIALLQDRKMVVADDTGSLVKMFCRK